MVESFKRYYHNSFLDNQRQEAYNLFLGNYIYAQGQPMLWDLPNDYYLHHSDPRIFTTRQRRSYIHWFAPEHLQEPGIPPAVVHANRGCLSPQDLSEDYWLEYYRPLAVSSFVKIFSFRMNSTLKDQESAADPSPFRVRGSSFHESPRRMKSSRKSLLSLDQSECASDDNSSQTSRSMQSEKNGAGMRARPLLLHKDQASLDRLNSDLELDGTPAVSTPSGPQHQYEHQLQQKHQYQYQHQDQYQDQQQQPPPSLSLDKPSTAHWTMDQYVTKALDPEITPSEADEYQRYLDHPHNLPLVVSTDTPPHSSLEFTRYLQSVRPETAANMNYSEADLAHYIDFLTVSDAPLTVTEADAPKKRYKAYRQWLKGKPLIKQQRVDPSFAARTSIPI